MTTISTPMHFPELPGYLTVIREFTEGTCVSDEGGRVQVKVRSSIHTPEEVALPSCCTLGYVSKYPNRWRAEVLAKVVERYGLTLDPPKYS